MRICTLLLQSVCTLALLTYSGVAVAQPKADIKRDVIAPQKPNVSALNKDALASGKTATLEQDATFRGALIETYQNNPRIISQRKSFEEAGERFNQAIAGWLPSVSLGYNKGRRRNRATGQRDWEYVDTQDKRLDISQPLFSGGETYYSTSQAENVIGASGAQLISTTQDVLTNAISSYLDVVRDRTILDLSRNNEKVLEKHLAASQDRFNVGEATKTDVSQSQARLSRSQSDTIQAEGNVAISEASFVRVVGFKAISTIEYPADMPPIPANLKEVTATALKLNPRIIAAGFTEDAAEDGIGINMARILPEVSLRGNMSRSKGTGISGIDYDTDAVLLDVSIPLYQGGAEYSRVREAKTIKSRRRFELLETTNEVRQQATEAWERYQTAVAGMEAQRDAIKAAETALDGVKQEQLYGTRTVLDVLDAEQELFTAKVSLERTERNRLLAVYNLLAITGQLSPANLKLAVANYDKDAVMDDVKYQFIGF